MNQERGAQKRRFWEHSTAPSLLKGSPEPSWIVQEGPTKLYRVLGLRVFICGKDISNSQDPEPMLSCFTARTTSAA